MVTWRSWWVSLSLVFALLSSTGCRDSDPDQRGVRLGLTAADIRTHFSPPGPGSWASEAGGTLRWTATTPTEPVHEAVFEFHQGMLVATRWLVDPASPEARGQPLEATPARVTTREPEGALVRVTTLSRSCPTHADEVARRLASGPTR